MYAIRYWFCEFLCLVNIVIQLIMMNKFFDGEFATYGWRWDIFLMKISEHLLHFLVFLVFWRIRIHHKTSVLIQWFMYFLESQSVSSTNMVLQDRFKSMIRWWVANHFNGFSIKMTLKLTSPISTVYFTLKYCKRENLHLHLVLVPDSLDNAHRTRHLQTYDHLCAISKSESAQCQKSNGATRNCYLSVE